MDRLIREDEGFKPVGFGEFAAVSVDGSVELMVDVRFSFPHDLLLIIIRS